MRRGARLNALLSRSMSLASYTPTRSMKSKFTKSHGTWNLSKMLWFGFGAALAIVFVLSLFSLRGVNRLLLTSKQLIEGNAIDAHFSQLVADHLNWSQQLSFLFTDSRVTEVAVQTDPSKCNLGKWLSSSGREDLESQYPETGSDFAEIVEWHEKLHESAAQISRTYDGGKDQARVAEASEIYSRQSIPSLERLQALLQDIRGKIAVKSIKEDDLLSEATVQRSLIAGFVVVCAFASIGISVLITRAAERRISRSANAIADASVSVVCAAEQLQSSSQEVASSTSQQASSLEETAAAMVEISLQTDANRKQAQAMSAITDESVQAVQSTRSHLDNLKSKIRALSDGSKKIRHVVQSIDEIAFQTNILALNASVEAARAGAAGAGFSVVADEVRALAQRAAASARETGEMIDASVLRISESEQHVLLCYGSFDRVLETSGSVRELVGQVAESSSEQANGISQINLSLSQMDRAVQANAAGAEESASAALEMRQLASNLEAHVQSLQQFAGARFASETTAKSEARQSNAPLVQLHPRARGRTDLRHFASRN